MTSITSVKDTTVIGDASQNFTSTGSLPDDGGENKELGTQEASAAVSTVEVVPPEERETWGSKLSYILTLVGYAVGFGNIWRFPYLLHANGGAAFFIPYFIMLFAAGLPIFFLELAIGQRFHKGSLGCWTEISPWLSGLGITSGLMCILVTLYYNTLIAWVISYIVNSFRKPLAWESCETAVSTWQDRNDNTSLFKEELLKCQKSTPTQYWWYERVLKVSGSYNEPGQWNWFMALYICIAWLLIWAIIVKGIKTSGKVVYFTAIFPYVILTIFFVLGFTLDGYENGYTILLKPDWAVLINPRVWLTAGTQIFFSLSVAYGCLIYFASYLPSNNNCYKDAVTVSFINCGTSVFAALVIFPIMGFKGTKAHHHCVSARDAVLQALFKNGSNVFTFDPSNYDEQAMIPGAEPGHEYKYMNPNFVTNQNTTINGSSFNVSPCNLHDMVKSGGSGTGLVFIAFAEAVNHLPIPQLWSFLFFTMLLTLGLDSAFGLLEGGIVVIEDLKLLKVKKWVLTSIICGVSMLISLVFAWGWGMYVLSFMDEFVSNLALLIVAIFECIGISWVYGLARFSYDIKLMTGKKPIMYYLICWKFVTPILLIFILLLYIIFQIKEGISIAFWSSADGKTISQPWPTYMLVFGFILTFSVVMWIPVMAVLTYFGKGLFKEDVPAFFPEDELRSERNMQTNEDEKYGELEELVMGKSVNDLRISQLSFRARSQSASSDPSHNPKVASE